jgi:hypothetical protein
MKRLLELYQQYSRVNAHVKSGEVTRADLATLQHVKRALMHEHNAASPTVQKKAAGIYKELMSQLDTTLDTVTRRLSSSRIHAAEQLGQRMGARRGSRTIDAIALKSQSASHMIDIAAPYVACLSVCSFVR